MRQPQRVAKHFDNVKNVNCQDAAAAAIWLVFSPLGWDRLFDHINTIEKSL